MKSSVKVLALILATMVMSEIAYSQVVPRKMIEMAQTGRGRPVIVDIPSDSPGAAPHYSPTAYPFVTLVDGRT